MDQVGPLYACRARVVAPETAIAGVKNRCPIASASNPLGLIIILAVLLRAAVMVRGSGAFDDPDNYLPMARSLASGEGFSFKGRPTAYRPPLYPLLAGAGGRRWADGLPGASPCCISAWGPGPSG